MGHKLAQPFGILGLFVAGGLLSVLLLGQGRSDEPAKKTSFFNGQVVPLKELVAKIGSKLDADAEPTWLALVTPHLDDGPIKAAGTIAKLLREGYTGYFIRTSNDEKDSFDLSLGETVLANERDTAVMIAALGLKKSFDLGYRNHRMDDIACVELRSRLIFLFRLLRVDTVISYDPWGHYEENPDHYVTARAVEAACWMSGGKLDLPEHFAAGLHPHSVSEKYYFARGPPLVHR